MAPVVVFTTTSDIEASVVIALLDSRGIDSFRVSGNPQAIWPMAVNALGDIKVAVAQEVADDALRVIDSHREDVGTRVVRLRDEFEELQHRIGYEFKDRGLLEHALTHRSRAAEDVSGGVRDNESLEFLGDAVLGLVTADMLFRRYPQYDEGQKSKIKASVVSAQALARRAEQIRLGDHLLLGRGEEKTGGRFKQALLADGYEALIAAVYLDGGLPAAAAFLERELSDAITEGAGQAVVGEDYKSALAGASAGAWATAARVSRGGAVGARSPQDVHDRSGGWGRSAQQRDREGQERSGAGSGPRGARAH